MGSKRILIAAISLILGASSLNAAYVPRRSWVQTGLCTYQDGIPYGSTDTVSQIYRNLKQYDLLINCGGTLMSRFRVENPNGIILGYAKLNTIYSPSSGFNQLPALTAWALANGAIVDSMLYKARLNSVTVTNSYGTRATSIGNYVEFFYWSDFRHMVDLRYSKAVGWYMNIVRGLLASGYDGIMEDEGTGAQNGQGRVSDPGSQPFPLTELNPSNYTQFGWPAYTDKQASDSFSRLLTQTFYPAYSESLYNAGVSWYFKNYAAYTYWTDTANLYDPDKFGGAYGAHNSPNDQISQNFIGHKNINLLLGEGCNLYANSTYFRHWQYMNYTSNLVDSGCKVLLWCGPQYVTGTDLDNALPGGKERAWRTMYAYYLQSAHPTRTWWIQNRYGQDTKTYLVDSMLYRKMIDYNIGTPLGKFIDSTRDANGPGYHYHIQTLRKYSNAVVLFRNPAQSGVWTYNLANDTALYHCTGFYELKDDGTLDNVLKLSIDVLSPDGRVMVPNTNNLPATTGSIGVSDASTVEGNRAAVTFTVTPTTAAGGTVIVSLSTANGTALSGTHYTGITSGTVTLNLPANLNPTTVTVFINTTNDNVPGVPSGNSRYFYVNYTITNVAPANVYIADPQAIVYITDAGGGAANKKSISVKKAKAHGRIVAKKP